MTKLSRLLPELYKKAYFWVLRGNSIFCVIISGNCLIHFRLLEIDLMAKNGFRKPYPMVLAIREENPRNAPTILMRLISTFRD